MIALGKRVKSTMSRDCEGYIVGYGILEWPDSEDLHGDERPQAVYLVRIKDGSSALGPACITMRTDRVYEVGD